MKEDLTSISIYIEIYKKGLPGHLQVSICGDNDNYKVESTKITLKIGIRILVDKKSHLGALFTLYVKNVNFRHHSKNAFMKILTKTANM